MREILSGKDIEIKGWGTLGNWRGFTVEDSRFFSRTPMDFEATGILFRSCLFENCHPWFEVDSYHDQGAEGCAFLTETGLINQ